MLTSERDTGGPVTIGDPAARMIQRYERIIADYRAVLEALVYGPREGLVEALKMGDTILKMYY